MQERDVDVYEAQSGDQAFERRFVPKGFEIGVYTLKVVERPRILPRENHQKQADFEREDGETDGEQSTLPALWGNRGS